MAEAIKATIEQEKAADISIITCFRNKHNSIPNVLISSITFTSFFILYRLQTELHKPISCRKGE